MEHTAGSFSATPEECMGRPPLCTGCRKRLLPEDSFCPRCAQPIPGGDRFPPPGAVYWSLEEDSRFCLWNPRVIWDRELGLLWQRASRFGLVFRRDALSFASILDEEKHEGLTGWRLPSLVELKSLLTPWINPWGLYVDPIFSMTDHAWCWSSETNATGRSYAVLFFPGTILSHDPTAKAFLRAVCPVPWAG